MAEQTKAEREAAGHKGAATKFENDAQSSVDEAKKAAGEALDALATAAKATAKAATEGGKAVAQRAKARGVILIPGGAWRRLYSARSTSESTRSIASRGRPISSSCSRSASSSM